MGFDREAFETLLQQLEYQCSAGVMSGTKTLSGINDDSVFTAAFRGTQPGRQYFKGIADLNRFKKRLPVRLPIFFFPEIQRKDPDCFKIPRNGSVELLVKAF